MFRTSSELGLLVVIAGCCASSGCNAITGLDEYQFWEPDLTHCGPDKNEDCTLSLPVERGSFTRSFDAAHFTDPCLSAFGPPPCVPRFKATVSSFRLDKFEVTVGRFRVFANAVEGGYKPEPESGRHDHVNGGKGLAFTGGHETGWSSDSSLPSSWSELADPNICRQHTWTPAPEANENLPINCLTWQEAYAFCIWDEGFLPSEAEWDYAASGGDEQRLFPWGGEKPDPARAIFGCLWNGRGIVAGPSDPCGTGVPGAMNIAWAGSRGVAGEGKFHQLDLAGNLAEWTMDFFDKPYKEDPCNDCMTGGGSTSNRVFRGGSFPDPDSFLALGNTGNRGTLPPGARRDWMGVRCARKP